MRTVTTPTYSPVLLRSQRCSTPAVHPVSTSPSHRPDGRSVGNRASRHTHTAVTGGPAFIGNPERAFEPTFEL